jgi:hypothetical protein
MSMTKKQTRIIGIVLLVVTLMSVTVILPTLFPSRMSRGGFMLVKQQTLTQMVLGYLVTGMTGGFGLALILWPFGEKKG